MYQILGIWFQKGGIYVHQMNFLLSDCGLAGCAAPADPDHEGFDQLRSLGIVPVNDTGSGYSDTV